MLAGSHCRNRPDASFFTTLRDAPSLKNRLKPFGSFQEKGSIRISLTLM
jgi:hypothetical protein